MMNSNTSQKQNSESDGNAKSGNGQSRLPDTQFPPPDPTQLLRRLNSTEYFEGVSSAEQMFGSDLSQIMATFSMKSNDDINLSDLATPKMKTPGSMNPRGFPEIQTMGQGLGDNSHPDAQISSPRRHSSTQFAVAEGGSSWRDVAEQQPTQEQFSVPPDYVRSRYNSRSYGSAQALMNANAKNHLLETINEHDDFAGSTNPLIGSQPRFSVTNGKRRVTLDGTSAVEGIPIPAYNDDLNTLNPAQENPSMAGRHARNFSDNFHHLQSSQNSRFQNAYQDYGGTGENERRRPDRRPDSMNIPPGMNVPMGQRGDLGYEDEQRAIPPINRHEFPNHTAFNLDQMSLLDRRSSSRRHSSPPRRHSEYLADGNVDADGYLDEMDDFQGSMRKMSATQYMQGFQGGQFQNQFPPGMVGANPHMGNDFSALNFSPMSPSPMAMPGFYANNPHLNGFNVGMGMAAPPLPQMQRLPQNFHNQGGRRGGFDRAGGGGRQFGHQKQNFSDAGISADMCDSLKHFKTTGQRPAMESLAGNVVEFSKDSHGSRFIQFKMETATEAEKKILIDEVLDDVVALACHPFGNYVMQNFMQHSSEQQREMLSKRCLGSMLKLSTHTHGCRVVQFALDILTKPMRNNLINEICDHIEGISKNNHGTHVVQKSLAFMTRETLESSPSQIRLWDAECESNNAPTTLQLLEKVEVKVQNDFLRLAVHPHSYRLVQLTISDCNEERSPAMKKILEKVRENYQALAMDQHGNFILQHLLDKGTPEQAADVQRFVCSKVLLLSQHKFGSHLVEKALVTANTQQVSLVIKQILEPTADNASYLERQAKMSKEMTATSGKADILSAGDYHNALLLLCRDPYANFVVQKAFKLASPVMRAKLSDQINSKSEVLSRFAYGRHILSHLT